MSPTVSAMRRVALIVVGVAALAGCSSSSGHAAAKPSASCVQALNAADQGFDAFSRAVTQTKNAFDVGMSGNPQEASAMLQQIQMPSPSRYKQLEAACRAASK